MRVAKKPVHRRPADQVKVTRQNLWQAIRVTTGPFGVFDIVTATKANRKTVRDYLMALTAGEYLEFTGAPKGSAGSWTLIKDVGNHAPRLRADGSNVTQGQATEQLWRGMQIQRDFSFRSLIETASIEIPEETASAYCKMLLTTGYLRVVKKASPARGQIAIYRLIRNDGPMPPQIQRIKTVFDPNTRRVYVPEGLA